MPIIETQSLSRSYGRRRGIEAVDLAVPEGAIFGFLGPNGAGKTTAIRVLVGLLRPSRGTARIFGLDCWRDGRRVKAEIGYMPGDLRLYSWLDGAAALSIFGRVRGRDLASYGRELAERLGLDLRVKVRKMSRGMRQKLGLILTLAHRPRLLVLDEPTVTLDPLAQLEVHRLLSEMAAAGHTVFFSSHTLSEVEQLCDRVAMIREGRLVANESLEALRSRAGHEVTIRWRDADAARATEPPAFLRLAKRDGLVWSGMLDGPVERLVRWLTDRAIDDLAIGRPDLETLFQQYYAAGEERR
ncbi:MAG: ABC transporter ATP-binding protein [Planctomycetia bacterium]|nr:ABC transporter ATP-binding protein [Planctomycetia bacterium]